MPTTPPGEAPLRVRLRAADLVYPGGLKPLQVALERFSSASGAGLRCLEIQGNAPAWPQDDPVGLRDLHRWGRQLAREARTSGALRVGWADGLVRGPGLELILACDLVVLGEHARVRLFPPEELYVPVAGSWTRAVGRSGPARLLPACLESDGVSAIRAVKLGLASAVLDAEGLDRLLLDLARSDARALSAVADLSRRGAGLGSRSAEALERAVFSWCFAGGNPSQTIEAFRRPGR